MRRLSLDPIKAVSALWRTHGAALTHLCLLMVCALFVERGHAQPADQPLPGPMTSQELARYADQLNLSAEQRRGLSSLHDQYKSDFKELRDGAITQFVGQLKLIDGMPFKKSSHDDLQRVLQGHRSAMSLIESLDENLFDQLQPLLTLEQAEAIPRVRADRERVRYINDKMVAHWLDDSMQIDLFDLFDRLQLTGDERAAGLAVLDAHTIQANALLRGIWNGSREMRMQWSAAMEGTGFTEVNIGSPDFDREMFQKAAAAWGEATARVKPRVNELAQLNRKTYHSLVGMLSPEQARDFRDEYFDKAHPFERPDQGVIASFQSAMKIDGLNADQRAAVAAGYEEFRSKYDVLLEALADVHDAMHTRERPNLTENRGDLEAKDSEIRTQLRSLTGSSWGTLRELIGPKLSEKIAEQQRADSLREMTKMARGGEATSPEEEKEDEANIAALIAGEATVIEFSAKEQENFIAPAISRSDLASIERQLALDDQQRSLLLERYDAYATEYNRIRREKMSAIAFTFVGFMARDQPDGTHRVSYSSLEDVEQAHRLQLDAIAALRALDESFISDIPLTVNRPDQNEKLWRVRLGREWTVYGRGGRQGTAELRCYGAYVNLIAILDRLDLTVDEGAAADRVLEEHAGPLQAALRANFDATFAAWHARDVALSHQHGPVRSSLEITQQMDAEFDALEAAAGRARHQLGAHNAAMLGALCEALPEHATDLHNAYEREAYPRVSADATAATRLLAAALSLDDLGQPQRDELQQLAAEYQSAYRTTCQQLIAASIEWDAQSQYTAEGQSKRKEIKFQWDQLCYDRHELNAGVRESMKRILTPAQLAATGLR